ncbi:alpha/beta hydrolase family protein [Microlunatus soli]|uniref:Prolyl oligopeptidase family protein n=1 Tax=Microlunatus soli TaxID=630515 RepID=A0A1H1R1U9_9ACTN|nr:prolyl oligopeptidase family serine peptidase [Microlunatus soli]SDS29586.1 Prolyl oligopeptidase family protein [Microlunatus soli]
MTPSTASNRYATSAGLDYRVTGAPGGGPRPTVINLASTADQALGQDFLQAGRFLLPAGYRYVGVELPCHGNSRREGEPEELAGWARRVATGEDFVGPFLDQLTEIVDRLIDDGSSDPRRMAITGTSRGGYLALQAVARDHRLRAVAAYAPVVDLGRLREFDAVDAELIEQWNVLRRVEDLVGRPVFLVIGDRDHRVGTDATISLGSALAAAAEAADRPSQLAMHVLSEPGGHTTPADGARLSAHWLHRVFDQPGGPLTVAGET